MKLYSMPSSGNSYKVRLLASLLDLPVTLIDVEDCSAEIDAAKREGRLPLGKAPALELDDGTILPESNAILWYLGQGTGFVPQDKLEQAQMLAWMFWEQNQHEGVIAVRGALQFYPQRRHLATPERMADLLDRGNALLAQMDAHLDGRVWFVGQGPSLADLALYAYTHTAQSRGGFDLSRYDNVSAWLARVASLPGYVGLDG